MARTKGALNKRTLAAMSEAETGKFKEHGVRTLTYLQKIVDDHTKPDDVRMRAADILLPYQKPRLAAIEQTVIDPRDKADPTVVMSGLVSRLAQKPELMLKILTEAPELQQSMRAALQQIEQMSQTSNVTH